MPQERRGALVRREEGRPAPRERAHRELEGFSGKQPHRGRGTAPERGRTPVQTTAPRGALFLSDWSGPTLQNRQLIHGLRVGCSRRESVGGGLPRRTPLRLRLASASPAQVLRARDRSGVASCPVPHPSSRPGREAPLTGCRFPAGSWRGLCLHLSGFQPGGGRAEKAELPRKTVITHISSSAKGTPAVRRRMFWKRWKRLCAHAAASRSAPRMECGRRSGPRGPPGGRARAGAARRWGGRGRTPCRWGARLPRWKRIASRSARDGGWEPGPLRPQQKACFAPQFTGQCQLSPPAAAVGENAGHAGAIRGRRLAEATWGPRGCLRRTQTSRLRGSPAGAQPCLEELSQLWGGQRGPRSRPWPPRGQQLGCRRPRPPAGARSRMPWAGSEGHPTLGAKPCQPHGMSQEDEGTKPSGVAGGSKENTTV